MIINPMTLQNKYKCNAKVMEYLVYKCHLPLLAISGDSYYFAVTDELKEAIKEMSLVLKVLSLWSK